MKRPLLLAASRLNEQLLQRVVWAVCCVHEPHATSSLSPGRLWRPERALMPMSRRCDTAA